MFRGLIHPTLLAVGFALGVSAAACDDTPDVSYHTLTPAGCPWDPFQLSVDSVAHNGVVSAVFSIFPASGALGAANNRANLLDGFSPTTIETPLPDTPTPAVWLAAAHAVSRFFVATPHAASLWLTCAPGAHGSFGLHLNQTTLPPRGCSPGQTVHTALPAAAMRPGWNYLDLSRQNTGRTVGLTAMAVAIHGQPAGQLIAAHLPGRPKVVRGLLIDHPASISQLLWVPPGAQLTVGWLSWTTGRAGVAVNWQVQAETDARTETLYDGHVGIAATEERVRIDLGSLAGQAVRLQLRVSDMAPWDRWLWTHIGVSTRSSHAPAFGQVTTPRTALQLGSLLYTYDPQLQQRRLIQLGAHPAALDITEHPVSFELFEHIRTMRGTPSCAWPAQSAALSDRARTALAQLDSLPPPSAPHESKP